jgi:hypothetical protein
MPFKVEHLDRPSPYGLTLEALVYLDSLDEAGGHPMHVLHGLAELIHRDVVVHH